MRLLAPLGLAALAFVTFACSSAPTVVERSDDDDDGTSSANRPANEGGGSSSGNAGSSSSGGQPVGSSSGTTPPAASCLAGDPFLADTLRADLAYLASEKLAGRAPGTSGDLAARTYIEQRFACLGLQPGGTNGYMMPFTNAAGTPTANVVAILPGSDPVLSKEFVVMSAHHDHFGTVGNKGLRLGANDNGSGIVGLLASARALKQRAVAPKRTVVFIAFGSEETATVAPYTEGSAAYVKAPPPSTPLDEIVYVVNFDMIGSYSLANGEVYALGSMKNTPAYPILNGMNKAGMQIGLGSAGDEGSSDHYPFCVAGIPFVFFWTDDPACYHKSCDTEDRIDYPHLGALAKMGADLAGSLGDTTTDLATFRTNAKVSQLGCTE